MTARLIVVMIVAFLCLGVLPDWNYRHARDYLPIGGLGLVLVLMFVLVVLGRI